MPVRGRVAFDESGLAELNAINAAVPNGTTVDTSAWSADNATNSFAGTTVESIVLELAPDDTGLRPGT
jgi:hypothetical protein